jgi:pectinesterase inhibitor-like protein
MEVITTKCLPILAIYLILLHHQITIAYEIVANDNINKVCAQAPNKDLCVKVLSSDPLSQHASLQDLGMISLKVAAANATGILTEVKTMINDPDLNPGIQQGLADCKETLLDAESQLEDTMAALLSRSKQDAQVWLKAALAAIDTCDASIPGDDDIISKQSVAFRQLCEIAVVISKAMAKDGQA